MGFMDKLFGSSKEYPPLNKDDPAAQKLDAMRQPVEKLVSEIKDPIEVQSHQILYPSWHSETNTTRRNISVRLLPVLVVRRRRHNNKILTM